MYYRIAIQQDTSPRWRWRSDRLRSLSTVVRWLQYFSCFPRERLRVFNSASPQELDEQLRRANQGLPPCGRQQRTSVPAHPSPPLARPLCYRQPAAALSQQAERCLSGARDSRWKAGWSAGGKRWRAGWVAIPIVPIGSACRGTQQRSAHGWRCWPGYSLETCTPKLQR